MRGMRVTRLIVIALVWLALALICTPDCCLFHKVQTYLCVCRRAPEPQTLPSLADYATPSPVP